MDSSKEGSGSMAHVRRAQPYLEAGTGDALKSPNGIPAIFFSWSDANLPDDGGNSNIANAVLAIKEQYPDEPINIIGHSWGGAAGVRAENELTDLGVNVDLLVTLDPVSRLSRPSPKGKDTPWINIYPTERTDSGPDTVAKIGGIWGQKEGALNIGIDSWPGKERGESGHMGVLWQSLNPALEKLNETDQ